ncbi:MAG: NAD(P)/FAD-dependent oxidoreductase [Phycisphaerae bacterium]|nr:NAD(P)/FAD-dependent oxidoreductase [Phycisphaerae bacterium]
MPDPGPNPPAPPTIRPPHVVIVGGGFAGLAAAKRLKHAPVRVTLVDQRNHHLFQPLLYQVATAALSPAQIAAPIRAVLSKQKNADVVLAEARRVDSPRRVLETDRGEIPYDYLILATGATHSYFGHDDWSRTARGLKTIDDALEIRRRFLLAFEAAENEPGDARRRALMTFVIIGAGPTGVETAGAIAEIARTVIRRDFRHIDTSRARVVLVEALDRVLPAGFPRQLSDRALADLRAMGVEVRLSTRVTHVAPDDSDNAAPHVLLSSPSQPAPERVDAHNIIWAAGVRASPLGASLGVPTDNAGRVIVAPDLSIPGHPEVFVTGDLSRCAWKDSMVPGVCPAAVQMGDHAARNIARLVAHAPSQPFRYVDKGSLATIGRAKAVASISGMKFGGLSAWLLWAVVHVFYLISFRNRVVVMLDWALAYLFFKRGSRLITGERGGASPTPSATPPGA